MKKLPVAISLLLVVLLFASSCGYERTYYHSRHGKVRHVRAARYPAWFDVREKRYSKRTRRKMNNWDRMQMRYK